MNEDDVRRIFREEVRQSLMYYIEEAFKTPMIQFIQEEVHRQLTWMMEERIEVVPTVTVKWRG